MDALMLTDSLESNSWSNKMKWIILKTLFTKDKNTDFKHQVDIISQAGKMSRKDFYTDVYGETNLALSQRAGTYITNIGRLNVAAISVRQESAPQTSVYNLTLEKENVYYANGILVANCSDALMLTFYGGEYVSEGGFVVNQLPERTAGMLV